MLKARSKWMIVVVAMILFAGSATPVQANSLNTQGNVEKFTHRQDSVAQATTPGQAAVDLFATSKISRASMSTENNSNSVVRTITTQAQSGEGVIRIVTRICDTADNWRSVAADNHIKPGTQPPYLVRLGQDVAVNCESDTEPDPLPRPPAPAPQRDSSPATTSASSGWAHPIPGACFSGGGSGFRTSARPSHDGVDIMAGFGTPLRAATSGTVSVGWQADGAGNYTMINHGDGVWTVYMHQSKFNRTSGWVNTGDVIGYVGSTGNSSGPHLHFEVHTGGLWSGKVNPMSFMQNHGVNLWC